MPDRDYAIISDGKVVNVLVVDDAALDELRPQLGGEPVLLDDHLDGQWGAGWGWDGSAPVPPPPVPTLTADGQLVVNGPAVPVTYTAHDLEDGEEVLFQVNSTTATATAANDSASIEVTTGDAGPVVITVRSLVLQLEAVAA